MFKKTIFFIIIFSLSIFLFGCNSSSLPVTTTTTDTSTTTTTTTTSTTTTTNPSSEWTEQTLSWGGTPKPVTSTCTIQLSNGTYRMYFTGLGGILTASSSNGLSWSAPTQTGVADTGATNPSVIKLNTGTYIMIYGIQTIQPVTERLYLATSSDGITFIKQQGPLTGGAVLIAESGENDFVSVPDLIYINSTTIRMYFVANTINNGIHTATSTDNGQTWTREGQISITGGSYGGQTNDPDIIQLTDNSYKLFFTTPPSGTSIGDLRIRSATSSDGINFILDSGDIKDPSGTVTSILDPDAVQIFNSSNYYLYYGTEPAGDLHVLISP